MHELRYLLAFGDRAESTAGAQGHAYLTPIVAIVAALLVLTLAGFVVRLARRPGRAATSPFMSTRLVWARTSVALLAMFVVQESLEGVLAPGHPAGVAAILGHGGWLGFPLAAAVGALIALALRGAAATEASAPAPAPWLRWPREPSVPHVFAAVARPRLDVLARFLAGRGPPPTFV